jgi:hypothetical protein
MEKKQEKKGDSIPNKIPKYLSLCSQPVNPSTISIVPPRLATGWCKYGISLCCPI